MWKERNARAVEGVDNDFANIKDRWSHTFNFIFFGHDINGLEMLLTT